MNQKQKHIVLIIKKAFTKVGARNQFKNVKIQFIGINRVIIGRIIFGYQPILMKLEAPKLPIFEPFVNTAFIREPKHEAKEYKNRLNYAKYGRIRK